MTIDVKAIRNRIYHRLDPDTASAAGMTIHDLQQFIAGTYQPTPEQLQALARLTTKERSKP